jgi:uncharacterized protein DUF3761
MSDARFSDDRKWWWDGKQWMSVTSDDGHWRWDGVAWQPVEYLPAAAAGTATGPPAANGFLRQIPGFRTMTPWKIVLACAGYGLAAFWLLAAIGAANPGMALFGFGVIALALLAANGWGMRSRIPGVRSTDRRVAGGTWAGLFVALLIASLWASPSVATASRTPAPVAESTLAPTVRPTATPRPSPSLTATPTAKPKPTPTATPTPTAVPTATPTPVPAPPAQAAADPYPAATAAGASAVCADGSWSYSQSRSGTCSGHKGVHWWTGKLGPAGPGAH